MRLLAVGFGNRDLDEKEREEREDRRLHESHEYLERHHGHGADERNKIRDDENEYFTREDITKKTE